MRPRTSSDHFYGLNNLLWIHNNHLGQVYLLVLDAVGNSVWWWEVGDGSITIGQTLHMEGSGCHSIATTNCTAGGRIDNTGLTITTIHHLCKSEGFVKNGTGNT